MSLSPGTRIGSYEILAPLGRGGMGEVWRARDTKLRREVAIKALPEEFAADPERRARFEREAHLLASLNHPNVAAIYGLEEAGDAVYLILELVEGETLTERLASGPLPAAEALAFATQIAAGLEAAHEAGVIHRDLKPSNVKVRPDGSVKVLDLGLARVIDPAARPDVSQSPTVTTGGTRSGVILGTAAYMSPEQARGRPLDKRSDIFSFGCVLFECLTGKLAFPGETVSDTLAAILTAEPAWSSLPASTPERVSALLRRCLQKERKQRLHDIADARIEIEEALATGASGVARAKAAAPPSRTRLAWGGGALLGAAIAWAALLLLQPKPRAAVSSVQAVLPLPSGVRLLVEDPSLAISPDGRTVVFRAAGEGGLLYRRTLDHSKAEPIQGTAGGSSPFFSPDGQWLGFFTISELKKVPLSGGTAITLSRVPPITAGGSWGADGKIVFTAQFNGALQVIAETGGQAQTLTTLDASKGEHAHLYPQVLPQGRGILFTLRLGKDFSDVQNSNIALLDPGTGRWRTVLEGASFARYGGGRLVFVRGASVFWAPFDLSRLEVTGPAVSLDQDIAVHTELGFAPFDISPAGTLALVDGPPIRRPTTSIVQLDRQGKETALPLPPGYYEAPRISPDGKRIAFSQLVGNRGYIVVYDRQRRNLSTLTPEAGSFFCPLWAPDGKRIAFTSFGATPPRLCVKNTDGSGEPEPLTESAGDAEFPSSWSPDGKVIAYVVSYTAERSPTRKLLSTDVWLVSPDTRGSAHPWFETPFRETAAAFSPDGKWIAYVAEDSGLPEVYVRPYPGPGTKIKISDSSGIEPLWTRGGRELLYRTGPRGETFMSVAIQTSPGLTAATPRKLLTTNLDPGGREDEPHQYDVSSDGNDIIGSRTAQAEEPSRQLLIVTNWTTTLSRAGSPK